MKKNVMIASTILLGAVVAGCIYLISHWSQSCAYLNSLTFHGNIDRLKYFVLSYGVWAPLISAGLMVAQSVILFLPAFPIFVVNSLSFGPIWGMLLSWSSAIAGSILCFTIAKMLGRPVVQRLVDRIHLETADAALRRYEKYIILLFGFIPVISFDVISYAAGLTMLAYSEFIPLVCISQVPSALFYSLLVNQIDRGALDLYWILGAVLFLLLGLGSLLLRGYIGRRKMKVLSPGC